VTGADPQNLENLLNEFLTSSKSNIKQVLDVSVIQTQKGTYCGIVTYEEKQSVEHDAGVVTL
jgi:hypothetical protein